MTPTENRPDRRPLAGVLLAAALLALVAALTGTSGCGRAPTSLRPDDKTDAPKGDPWQVAGQRLRKDSDLAAVRAALGGLATDLNTQNKEPLPALSEAEFAELAKLVQLSAEDREEVRATTFTAHDFAYVADCLYMRDAARSLSVTGFPAEQQAEIAFAWVCRQVYLQPWLRVTGQQTFITTALPPTAVLRRGSGSGLERMYVFLALLQQLELDACLIGGPSAGPSTNEFQVNAVVNTPAGLAAVASVAPRGPFWAVGVRAGNDVRLFDPWRGTQLPFTLAQLKANPAPDAAKAWFADAGAAGPTLADAQKATAYLAVPVNALAPRMATVSAKLKGDIGAKLSYDAKTLRAAFPDSVYWNPPADPSAYGRASRLFLPNDLGGSDRGAPGGRLYDSYQRDQLPVGVFRVPPGLAADGPAAQRLRAAAAGMLWQSYIEPPNPRELIQRGQFQDAAKDLVSKQESFSNGLERLRLNRDADQQMRDWIEAIDGLYQEIGRAQLRMDKTAEATALTQIENHWKQPGFRYIVDRLSSEVGLAEASLLLALCKHELAERSQARVDRATGAEADRLRPDALDSWKTAVSAWRTYEQLAGAHAGFPGRAAHAQALAARAEKLAKPPAK